MSELGPRRARRELERKSQGGISRRLLLPTALVLLCTTVGVTAAGGTYALLNANMNVSGATISAGDMSLRINSQSSTTLASVQLAAGSSNAVAFTVTNVGDVAADLSASITATSSGSINSYVQARITPVASAAGCTTGLAGTQAKLDGYAVSSLDALAAGATKTYCLERSVPASTPVSVSGQSLDFTLTMSTQQKQ